MFNKHIQLLVNHDVGVFRIITYYKDITATTDIVDFEVNNGDAVLLLWRRPTIIRG